MRCLWTGQALSARRCTPRLAPLDPKGLVLAMWTGRLRAISLAVDRACVCLHVVCQQYSHLATVSRVWGPPFVAAPQLRVCVLPLFGYACACSFVAAPLVWACPSAAAAAAAATAVACGLPSPLVAAPLLVTRTWPCREPSTSRPALPCPQGTSASSLAAFAISALPAGSTPAVRSARAGAAPTTGNAPLVRPCQLTGDRRPPPPRSRACQQVRNS